ncbi:MAG: ATP-binding protein [Deltaproteobacteria bacterium]
MQPRRGSSFHISRILWLLAAFGILHGSSEWLDMWAIIKGREETIDLVRWFFLVVSYLCIFEFGRRLVRHNLMQIGASDLSRFFHWGLTPTLGSLIMLFGFSAPDFWKAGSSWTRYLYGFPGAVLTGLGFVFYYSIERERLEPLKVAKYFYVSGVMFCAYGLLGGLVVPPGDFFPADWLNTVTFSDAVGVPVQVFRLVIALVSAWSVASILRIFNWEAKTRLQEALDAVSDANVTLDERVMERTAELQEANARLKAEAEERSRLEGELLKAQKLESLGVLAGGIAHDFNNILTSILGNISLARKSLPPGDKAVQRLDLAEKSSLRARNLAQQLLTFAKGGAPIKKVIILPPLIREAVEFTLQGSRVRAENSFPPDLRPVEADESQMNQVISNLALNAVQAMPEGGILSVAAADITLSSGNDLGLPAGEYVRIDIKDQGVGIPEEDRGKIFDPFFTTKERGSGLGLSTSFSIIKRHGGTITVVSNPGEGSTFSIFLPASKKKTASPSKEEQQEIVPGFGRIMVMDDEETVREVAAEILEHLGYRAETVKEGAEAIIAYRQAIATGEPFDAVIVDLTVPAGMGGKETIQHLLEIDPQAKVIVSSGYGNDPIMSNYLAYGFKGVVPKPFCLSGLSKTLKEVLNGKE